jgi:hypothetical protein
VTEAEATAGILNSDCIRNRVLAYFRTFEDLKVTDEKAGWLNLLFYLLFIFITFFVCIFEGK